MGVKGDPDSGDVKVCRVSSIAAVPFTSARLDATRGRTPTRSRTPRARARPRPRPQPRLDASKHTLTIRLGSDQDGQSLRVCARGRPVLLSPASLTWEWPRRAHDQGERARPHARAARGRPRLTVTPTQVKGTTKFAKIYQVRVHFSSCHSPPSTSGTPDWPHLGAQAVAQQTGKDKGTFVLTRDGQRINEVETPAEVRLRGSLVAHVVEA